MGWAIRPRADSDSPRLSPRGARRAERVGRASGDQCGWNEAHKRPTGRDSPAAISGNDADTLPDLDSVTSGVTVAPTPPGAPSALSTRFPPVSSLTPKKGKRRGVSLVFVNVAVMVNVPAGPSGTGVGSETVSTSPTNATWSLTMGKNSKAPMSQAAVPSLLPSTTRGLPRWSVARGSPVASRQTAPPASMAGLPRTKAWV
jgi:hypothetical protein